MKAGDVKLSVKEVAEELGVSTATIYEFCDPAIKETRPDVFLPNYKIGGRYFVKRSDLDAWVAKRYRQ